MFKYANKMKTMGCMRRSTLQQGSALIIALVFLLALTMIGTTAMQGTSQQEKVSGNMRDHNLAFQAAEAALRAGERTVLPPAVPPPPANFGANNGYLLAQYDSTNSPNNPGSFWTTFFQQNPSLFINGTTVPPTPPNLLALAQVSQQPSYFIEDRTLANPPNAADPLCAGLPVTSPSRCYRVTARGVGGTTDAVVILQSTIFRP